MSDYIKRENALSTFSNAFYAGLAAKIKAIPPEDVAPVRHEEDGTLWVTVGDCETVGRVIVKNELGHFCRVFYMGDGDEEPVRHGRWINSYKRNAPPMLKQRWICSLCGNVQTYGETRYCPNCGAKMDEGEDNED